MLGRAAVADHQARLAGPGGGWPQAQSLRCGDITVSLVAVRLDGERARSRRGKRAAHDGQAVAAEFSQQEVAALVSLIVTINAWNAIGVSTRAWVPGTYQA